MSLSFGGLATGLDTSAIVNELMQMERRPINRLQTDKAWQNNRLSALSSLDSKLKSFLTKIEDFDSSSELRAKKAKLSSEEYFTASADPDALPGSYEIEVVNLAQVEKNVSTVGFADKSAKNFGAGTISLKRGTDPAETITIDGENNSLEGIAKAINDADAGMTASIINDGSANPYRLVLTGEKVGEAIDINFSGLSGGSYSLSNGTDPEMIETQEAKNALIRVDNIEIESDSNTFTEAIPDVSLTLNAAEVGKKTTLTVDLDQEAIKGKIKDFVSGYNDVMKFIIGQSKAEGSKAGVLVGDSGINSIKRHLQDMLTNPMSNSGVFTTISQLGLETQKDGTLSINDAVLDKAIGENLDSVDKLLAGEGEVDGIATRFKDYLDGITDSVDGFLKGRKDSIQSNIRRIDNNIDRMEVRLEKREANLYNQFNALEQLVSTMNSQSNYLGSQLKALESMWSYKK